jgi:hypothetical protein
MKKILILFIMISGVFGLGACWADNWSPSTKEWNGKFWSWNCNKGISNEYGAYAGGKNKDEPYDRNKYIGPCADCHENHVPRNNDGSCIAKGTCYKVS